jgi:hypothetical protein
MLTITIILTGLFAGAAGLIYLLERYLAGNRLVYAEVTKGVRCSHCLERYTDRTRDCSCTNWGGFIGV